MWPIERLLLTTALVSNFAWATSSNEATNLAERPARTSSRDIKVPRALVQMIDREYRAFLTENEISVKENIKRKLLSVSVELTQKRTQALHENVRVVAPLGGGVVDLADFVTPLRGAFALKIVAKQEDGTGPVGLRVFFVPKTKSRMLDGESYGSDCDKIFEITNYFHKRAARGFELYTADQRYLSVAGGTFVVFSFTKEALMVGTLNFTDSRYPDLFCE